jgi:hypothetical protein
MNWYEFLIALGLAFYVFGAIPYVNAGATRNRNETALVIASAICFILAALFATGVIHT